MKVELGIAALALAATGLIACGDDAPEYPHAAEPADAPALTQKPAGQLFDVGVMPEGLTVDPATGLIAIGLRDPNLLAIFDPGKGEVVRKVALSSAPRHLSFDEQNHSVLVAAEQTDELIEVPLPNGKPVRTPVGDHPHDAVAAPDGRIFVGDEFGDTVSVVDDGKLVKTIKADVQPGGVADAGRYIAVIAVAQRTLGVIDSHSLRQIASVPAGDGPTHIETMGKRAFVADTDGGAVLEYEIGPKPRMLRSTKVEGAPYGTAIDEQRKRLWITQTALNEAIEFAIEPDGLRKIATYPTVRQPNTITIEPASGDAYIASRTDGQLQRISPKGD
ncbi:lipoprotein [soil metagenome]